MEQPTTDPAHDPAQHASGPRAASGVPAFRERLAPGVGPLLAAVCLGASLGFALWIVSALWGFVLGGAAAVAFAVALWRTAPVVAFSGAGTAAGDGVELHAGRARIPVALLAAPRALDGPALRAELGPGSDARVFACLRPWVMTAVRVEVRDPADPTPAWLVGSRRPEELAAALRAAGAAAD